MSEIQKYSMQYHDEAFGHHEKCLSFFERVERGEIIYVCLDGTITGNGVSFSEEPINGFSQTNTVSFSILNDEMISYDKKMLESLKDEYKPFFCGFNAQLELDNWDNVQGMQGNWFEGKFVSEEVEYIFDDKIFTLDGFLQTSASPINSIKGRLIIFKDTSFKKTVLDQINRVYNPSMFSCASNVDVQTELDSAWGDCIPKTIDIYNVGHGNCDYIRGDGRRILYDVGYNYPMVPRLCETSFPRAVKAMRKMKPSVVIISHWDLDHFIGCAYADKDLFNVKWIAPALVNGSDSAGINAMRIAHYLYKRGNLLLVDRNSTNKMIANVNCLNGIQIKLWLGTGKSKYITQRNIESLTIEILDLNGNFPHVFLAGDVPYHCISPSVFNSMIEFMHVPHHCSKMELARLKTINPYVKGKYAIVSTNRNIDDSINCDNIHQAEIEKRFENLIFTIDNEINDDNCNLSIVLDCCRRIVDFR